MAPPTMHHANSFALNADIVKHNRPGEMQKTKTRKELAEHLRRNFLVFASKAFYFWKKLPN
jgi:hypothetical protein